MNIFLNNEQFYIENSTSEDIINLVNIHSKENNLITEYIEVNGELIYDWETYIQEEILSSINRITFKLLTKEELALETLYDAQNYINNALIILEDIIQDFYIGKSAEHWSSMVDLIDGLSFLDNSVKVIQPIFEMNESFVAIPKKVESFANIYPELEQALISQDEVLIADILKYELTPLFEELSSAINSFLEESKA